MKIDFKEYESEMGTCIERAVSQVMAEFPDEHFYAAALHEFYRETGDRITLPCLAVNTSEEIDESGDSRWSSADWYWIDLKFASERLLELHDELENEASRLTTTHWDKVHTQWMNALVRVAKQLTRSLKKQSAATKDFGFFLFDEEGDEIELLRRCMSAAKFKRVFPHLQKAMDEEKADAALPAKQQLAKYKEDLYAHGDKLIEHGEAAIPILLDCLDNDERQRWCAARLLASLGIPNADVIRALKHHACVKEHGRTRFHMTTALAILGDVDFVLDIANKADTRDAAIDGIRSLYRPWDDGFAPVPLDYSPLERLLSIKSCTNEAQELSGNQRIRYAIPSPVGDIRPEDVGAAVAGTTSKYKMIREHAVRALGDRKLGKAASVAAMQAVVDCFSDRAMTVRFLAALNIGYWKKAAKAHVPAIRKLMENDPDSDVRLAARQSIEVMGFEP